jgi:hypothetical protein
MNRTHVNESTRDNVKRRDETASDVGVVLRATLDYNCGSMKAAGLVPGASWTRTGCRSIAKDVVGRVDEE